MKKITSLLSAVTLSILIIFTACDSDDDAKPVVQFTANIDGQPFTSKIIKARFFTQDQEIDVEGHELDSTYSNQYVIGLQVEYSQLNKPTEYDFAEHEAIDDVIFYMFNNDGKSYSPKEGKLKIRKISPKHFEATFSSLVLKSGSQDALPITLTDGTVQVDLTDVND